MAKLAISHTEFQYGSGRSGRFEPERPTGRRQEIREGGATGSRRPETVKPERTGSCCCSASASGRESSHKMQAQAAEDRTEQGLSSHGRRVGKQSETPERRGSMIFVLEILKNSLTRITPLFLLLDAMVIPAFISVESMHCGDDFVWFWRMVPGAICWSLWEDSNKQVNIVLKLAQYITFTQAYVVTSKTHVRIANDLAEGLNLTLHCKSKDDDLGIKIVPYHYYYEWSFKVNIFETTLYFCAMNWRDASGTFDVYVAKRDRFRCTEKCWWMVREDGLYYRNDRTGDFDFWFGWPKPPM
ncbi:hypothetical protein HHK36_020418 [Tetracentron sinense]|uniref:S-protein homolog n=1 Tax=Tetracentron sinense TaxID=13715 RepID=A0A834YX32_TETSI|nr:hypothetical protein HHK36_020418 [Tetracentron sinense]